LKATIFLLSNIESNSQEKSVGFQVPCDRSPYLVERALLSIESLHVGLAI
jgi:hypothetical protein